MASTRDAQYFMFSSEFRVTWYCNTKTHRTYSSSMYYGNSNYTGLPRNLQPLNWEHLFHSLMLSIVQCLVDKYVGYYSWAYIHDFESTLPVWAWKRVLLITTALGKSLWQMVTLEIITRYAWRFGYNIGLPSTNSSYYAGRNSPNCNNC
jgi:hypothetical protein